MADVKTLIPAGGTVTLRRVGDFVFTKYTDRELVLDIKDGEGNSDGPVTVKNGSMRRPPGGISEIEVTNPDQVNPCAAVFYIGKGDFDDKIIQGEVTVTPGIRGADGRFVDDTRSTLSLRVAIGNIEPKEYVAGDLIRDVDVPTQYVRATELPGGRLLLNSGQSDDKYKLVRGWMTDNPTVENIQKMGLGPGVVIGAELWVPNPVNGNQTISYAVYDAATLKARRSIGTDAPWFAQIEANPQLGAVDTDGDNLYQCDQYRVHKISRQGEYLGSVSVGGFVRAVIVRGGRVHIYKAGANLAGRLTVVDPVTMAVLPLSESKMPDDAIAISKHAIIHRERQSVIYAIGNSVLEEYALFDVTISVTGSVTSCKGGGFIKKLQNQTRAAVYAERLENGRVLLSGEIIRAALEIHAGRYMPENYLDYVYRVRAENIDGIAPRTIESGGRSFLAAGIADDAAGVFPQTIEITLREGLL